MAFTHPEWEDVIYGYLVYLHGKTGKPASPKVIARSLSQDMGKSIPVWDIEDALDSLEDKELVVRRGNNYTPLAKGAALRMQLSMEEVEPFTREPGEVLESHMDRVWPGDASKLVKPGTIGGKYGLYPVGMQFIKERPFRGLTLEE